MSTRKIAAVMALTAQGTEALMLRPEPKAADMLQPPAQGVATLIIPVENGAPREISVDFTDALKFLDSGSAIEDFGTVSAKDEPSKDWKTDEALIPFTDQCREKLNACTVTDEGIDGLWDDGRANSTRTEYLFNEIQSKIESTLMRELSTHNTHNIRNIHRRRHCTDTSAVRDDRVEISCEENVNFVMAVMEGGAQMSVDVVWCPKSAPRPPRPVCDSRNQPEAGCWPFTC